MSEMYFGDDVPFETIPKMPRFRGALSLADLVTLSRDPCDLRRIYGSTVFPVVVPFGGQHPYLPPLYDTLCALCSEIGMADSFRAWQIQGRIPQVEFFRLDGPFGNLILYPFRVSEPNKKTVSIDDLTKVWADPIVSQVESKELFVLTHGNSGISTLSDLISHIGGHESLSFPFRIVFHG